MSDVWEVGGSPLDLDAVVADRPVDEPHDGAAVGSAATTDDDSTHAAVFRRARAVGWVPLHEAPLYQLVPAAWPPTLRRGICDPHTIGDNGRDHERAAGLPPAPAGRQ